MLQKGKVPYCTTNNYHAFIQEEKGKLNIRTRTPDLTILSNINFMTCRKTFPFLKHKYET